MEFIGVIIVAFLVLLLIFILIKIFKSLISFFRPDEFISEKIKRRADKKFNKLYFRFKNNHNRNPNRDEVFRIIIDASHITIRWPGKKGHFERQKIRKYLLEKHGVVKDYKMK